MLRRSLLLACVLFVLPPAAPEAATPRNTLVIAREISGIGDWDPAVSQIVEVGEINTDIYDRLLGYDPRDPKELAPQLAESWTVSPDGQTFTFVLRQGVKFHSGNPLTAHDVAYSFKRMLLLGREPSTGLIQIGMTKENIAENARAADDRTFVLRTPERLAPSYILNLVSSSAFGIVDSKLLEGKAQDGDFGSKWLSRRGTNDESAGSGPFRIQTYRASELVVLERNPAYWRFPVPMARVLIRHVPEAATQRLLLERGDVDIAHNLTSQDIDALRAVAGVKIREYPSRRIQYFGFNTAVKPFDDPSVREAMKHLIDYDGLEATTMKGLGRVRQTFIPTGYLGALEEKPFRLDVEKAKALLTEAGLPDGFSFRLLAYNRLPEMDLATAFQATAAKAGVRIEVVTMPGSQVIPLYRDRKLDALLLSYYGQYADPHALASKFAFNPAALPGADPNAKWPSELTWRLGWAPKELSEMVVAASRELDEARRVEQYGAIQRLYFKSAPFAQIFQSVTALGMRDGVEGYQSGTRGADTTLANVSKQ
jgi:peptide/nickel transport system substrate-binding protein